MAERGTVQSNCIPFSALGVPILAEMRAIAPIPYDPIKIMLAWGSVVTFRVFSYWISSYIFRDVVFFMEKISGGLTDGMWIKPDHRISFFAISDGR